MLAVLLALPTGLIFGGCGQPTAEEMAGAEGDPTWDAEPTEEEAEETRQVEANAPPEDLTGEWKKEAGLYAVFDTSKGTMVCRLFEKKAPLTVANITGLAKGTKEWKDPKTGEMTNRPFYDGLIFHRVVPDFMIQGGCPLGNGTGGPGFQFKDEFDPSLRFDKKGKLAMANSGPGTNGSQFFITLAPTPHLNDRHTIFGEVVAGQEVVEAISKVETTFGGGGREKSRPVEDIVLKSLKIYRVADEADAEG